MKDRHCCGLRNTYNTYVQISGLRDCESQARREHPYIDRSWQGSR
jgi:hypothetical protein